MIRILDLKSSYCLEGGGEGVEKHIYSQGKLVRLKNNSRININELRIKLKENFIVQEVVKQHPELAKYHPSSLNTLKI